MSKIGDLTLGINVVSCAKCDYKRNYIEWVSAIHKPDIDYRVIINSPEIGIDIGWWDGENWRTETLNSVEVTHWQPLPLPPEVQK